MPDSPASERSGGGTHGRNFRWSKVGVPIELEGVLERIVTRCSKGTLLSSRGIFERNDNYLPSHLPGRPLEKPPEGLGLIF